MRWRTIARRACLLVAVLLAISGTQATGEELTYVAGELVVQMEEGAPIDIVNTQFGTNVAQELPLLNIYLLNTGTPTDLEVLAADIQALSEVVFCHPNYLIDPLQPVQSSLPVSDGIGGEYYFDQPAMQTLTITAAQAFSTGRDVRVAVLDGGINYEHPGLNASAMSGYDYVDDDPDALDELGGVNSGHGTFVSGVIHLVAPDADILAYRVTDLDGESNGYIVAEAMLQAIEDSCRVINLSMVTMEVHNAIAAAAQYARDNDVFVVSAAGNGYSDSARYPAADPNIVGVAAVDNDSVLADFSSYGDHVDVCAPGVEIYAPYTNDEYAWWGGTSFAAPFVSAQAALLVALVPDITWEELHNTILGSATPIDAENGGLEGMLGAGLINPFASLADFVCGNVNGDSENKINLADIANLLDYLYYSHAQPVGFAVADVDNWEGITGNDVQKLIDNVYYSKAPLDCQPDSIPPFTPSIQDLIEIRNITIPAHNDTWSLEVWVNASGEWGGFCLPFIFDCTNPAVAVDHLEMEDTLVSLNADFSDYDSQTSKGFLAVHIVYQSLMPAGWQRVGTIHLTSAYSDQEHTVLLDTCFVEPGATTFLSLDVGHRPVTPSIAGLAGSVDMDNDGASDDVDNCRFLYNPDQADSDGDGYGDACDICAGHDDDVDNDSDGIPDGCDNCPYVANVEQGDSDGDGSGNLCDLCEGYDDAIDPDGDGFPTGCDNCPTLANPGQTDYDEDGIGDGCDDCVDEDGDGYGDPRFENATCPADNCLDVYNPDQNDGDGDGIGDACDYCPDVNSTNNADYDHDGLGDICDNCPGVNNPDQVDADHNGIGDACEGDYACGNIDADLYNKITLADFTCFVDHLFISQQPLSDPANADIDDWVGITFNDLSRLADFIYGSQEDLDCNPGHSMPFPVSANCTLELRNLTVPAGNDRWAVEVWVNSTESWSGLAFGFSYEAQYSTPHLDSIVLDSVFREDVFYWAQEDWQEPIGMIATNVMWDVVWQPEFPPGESYVGSIYFSGTEAASDQQLYIDTSAYGNSPVTIMSLDGGKNPVTPTFIGIASVADADSDGIVDRYDNCPFTANPDQTDSDDDGIGNLCDNCPLTANPVQENADGDEYGDSCDECPNDPFDDQDDDGICGDVDNCPELANADQTDSDADSYGDACDACSGFDDGLNADGDIVPDGCDNCPTIANDDQSDRDLDGLGDVCDLCPDGPEGECYTFCSASGDVDFDGVVDHDDLTYLIDYVYLAGLAPPNPVNADCDDHLGITTRDVMYLNSYINGAVPDLSCPPSNSEPPAIDSGVVLNFPTLVEPYASQFAVPLSLRSSVEVLAFNLPLEIRVNDSLIPTIDSFVISSRFREGSGYEWEFTPDIVFRVDSATGTALVSAVAFYGAPALPVGTNPLGTLYLSIWPSSAERELSMDWGTITPVQPMGLDYPDDGLYPVVISPGSLEFAKSASSGALSTAAFLPEVGPVLEGGDCCVGDRDDINGDSKVNLADISRLIDFVYLDGSEPDCLAEANVDGDIDQKFNLADITFLIDLVYLHTRTPVSCGAYRSKVVSTDDGFGDGPSLFTRPVEGGTELILETSTQLRGVQMQLTRQNSRAPMQLCDSELDMYWHHKEGVTNLVLVDVTGEAVIKTGRHVLLRFDGEVELIDGLAADLEHVARSLSLFDPRALRPDGYHLSQNRPNPFNPSTEIEFSVPVAGEVHIEVFNILGRRVADLLDETMDAGTHVITWDGTDSYGREVASGVYFYRLSAEDVSMSKKMLLLK